MFSFLKRNKTNPKTYLKRVLGDYQLPSFPGSVLETLQRIRKPNSSAVEISEIISVDPGLSVSVLRLANSAVFSPRTKVENINQAVSLIGMSQLESLVLSIGVGSTLPHHCAGGYDYKKFWRASARRGTLARSLAAILCPARQSECFSAGFLQDMALPFLTQQNPRAYESILNRWNSGEGEIVELERTDFDWDHAEVATWICSEWDLPESIASAVGGHHGRDTQMYNCPPPVSLVAHIRENDHESSLEALIEDAHTKYGISSQRVTELVETCFQNADEIARLMN